MQGWELGGEWAKLAARFLASLALSGMRQLGSRMAAPLVPFSRQSLCSDHHAI